MPVSPAVPARGSVGVMLPLDLPVGEVLPYVRRAGELGFDQVWVVEDLGRRGGVAQAATVLASTTNLTVGIGIMPAGARNVAFAAMELATLAQLHPGRLIAGIGHGMPAWMRQVGSRPASPLTLIKEYARALRLLIAGKPGPENGRYVRCEGVVLTEIPDIVPPVILGVRGPRSQAVAGEVADGLLLAEPAAPGYSPPPCATWAPPRTLGRSSSTTPQPWTTTREPPWPVSAPSWSRSVSRSGPRTSTPCPSPRNCAHIAPPAATPGTSPRRCPPTGSVR
ncbi:LLM class flavin-dependent oxidoreductase [Streptomyces sp. NPDC005483]|uniref:LLM class flavin-dependent oxidoreductase n=1 Tax=Streptomyces sp. NPDC005483 TaxID=3154882 RepID=UPI0033B2C51E